MGATEVRSIAGRAELRRFVDYAYERNADDPHWIPELRLSARERLTLRKNPFFAHADVELLLAWRGGAVVGRIAAIDDRLHNETHGDNLAMFGFFEAADAEAADALLRAAESWAKRRGRTAVRGPISPSLNEVAGLLVDGFDTDPMLMMPRNPPEYARFIESAGYSKVKDLFAWLYMLRPDPPPFLSRLADLVRDRAGVTIRTVDAGAFDREAEALRRLYTDAWERNWGFVAPTPEEFRRITREMKPILDPRCTVCAEKDGRMVACLVAIPDINQALKGTNGRLTPSTIWRLIRRNRYITQARLLLLGVDAAYRNMGLFALLISELNRQLVGTQYRHLEFSWVLEDNYGVNQPAERSGAVRYQTYRIYQKAI